MSSSYSSRFLSVMPRIVKRSSTALAKEERLIKELDLLDKCADKIVTTAESRIKEQELDEFLIGLDIPILSPTPDPDFDAFLAIPEGASTEAS